jgi:pimeloyl-ACP methyl ester carboxylesterase
VFRISGRTLTEAARRDARVAWVIAEELNRRLYEVLEQTAVNAFGSVRQRVAAHLLDLASGRQQPGGPRVAAGTGGCDRVGPRGGGKNSNQFEISVTRMVDDTVTLLELLHDRFGGKTVVAGFSFGATFAAYAAMRRPELVAALVATGMDIDLPVAADNAYAFALDAARQRGHRRAIRQLEAIGAPPHTTMRQFTTRAPLGGQLRRRSGQRDLQQPAARATGQLGPLARLFRRGCHPHAARDQRFHDSLAAPSKQLVWFESSAHSPHLEEPVKFRDLLMNVRAGQFAST